MLLRSSSLVEVLKWYEKVHLTYRKNSLQMHRASGFISFDQSTRTPDVLGLAEPNRKRLFTNVCEVSLSPNSIRISTFWIGRRSEPKTWTIRQRLRIQAS